MGPVETIETTATAHAVVEAPCTCRLPAHPHPRPCGAPFPTYARPDRRGTYGNFCLACRKARRQAGQVQRRARERQGKPAKLCAWPGCDRGPFGARAAIRPTMSYCSRAHFAAARRGRGRHGADITCGCRAPAHAHGEPCRAPIGYVRRSRIRRAKRHYCLACRVDRPWLRRRPRPRGYCRGCGRTLLRGAKERCLACRRRERERAPYRHLNDEDVAGYLAAGISQRQIARKAEIARSTVCRIRDRLAAPPRSGPFIVPTHPGVGTLEGFHYHERHAEPLCEACHAAHAAYLRDRHHGRREGRPGTGRRPPSAEIRATYRQLGRPRQPIVHGTVAGYSAHRRRGEHPCSACRAGWRAANQRRAAEHRAERPPARTGRPLIVVAPSIVARVLAERGVGRSYATIVAGLTADDVPPPGTATRWYPGTVRTIERRAGVGSP